MLSFSSWQKMSITSQPSTPTALATLPISLPKATLTACQALSAYFTISATSSCGSNAWDRAGSRRGRAQRRHPRDPQRRPQSFGWIIIIVDSGRASRRNSGLFATCNPAPSFQPGRALERRNYQSAHGTGQDRSTGLPPNVAYPSRRFTPIPISSAQPFLRPRYRDCRCAATACRRRRGSFRSPPPPRLRNQWQCSCPAPMPRPRSIRRLLALRWECGLH